MARIQVLPLPTQRAGDIEQTPFIIVLDRMTSEERGSWLAAPELITNFKVESGAAVVLLLDDDLDVSQPLVLGDDQQAAILEQLLPVLT